MFDHPKHCTVANPLHERVEDVAIMHDFCTMVRARYPESESAILQYVDTLSREDALRFMTEALRDRDALEFLLY